MTCEASGAGEQVRDCMLQAEQCAFRAKIEPDPVVAREYLNMERRCLSLARVALNSKSGCNRSQAITKNDWITDSLRRTRS